MAEGATEKADEMRGDVRATHVSTSQPPVKVESLFENRRQEDEDLQPDALSLVMKEQTVRERDKKSWVRTLNAAEERLAEERTVLEPTAPLFTEVNGTPSLFLLLVSPPPPPPPPLLLLSFSSPLLLLLSSSLAYLLQQLPPPVSSRSCQRGGTWSFGSSQPGATTTTWGCRASRSSTGKATCCPSRTPPTTSELSPPTSTASLASAQTPARSTTCSTVSTAPAMTCTSGSRPSG
eukprot:759250-Hanusia_phi.AAC.1